MVMFLHCLSFTLSATLATRVQPAWIAGCLKELGRYFYEVSTWEGRRIGEKMTTVLL